MRVVASLHWNNDDNNAWKVLLVETTAAVAWKRILTSWQTLCSALSQESGVCLMGPYSLCLGYLNPSSWQ